MKSTLLNATLLVSISLSGIYAHAAETAPNGYLVDSS